MMFAFPLHLLSKVLHWNHEYLYGDFTLITRISIVIKVEVYVGYVSL